MAGNREESYDDRPTSDTHEPADGLLAAVGAVTALVAFGETMLRLSPPRGERLERARELDVQAGGAESNVAVGAARLGADATWVSKLPDSSLGRRVVSELRSHGVDTAVSWTDAATSRVGTYYLEHGVDPRETTVIYDRADAAITTITPDELPRGPIEAAEYVHTTGITPALASSTAETTQALLQAAGETGATRTFDLNYRAKLWDRPTARATYESLFPSVDVLFIPERDARAVLGLDGEAEAIARELTATYDFETVVVTRGAAGALARHGNETYEQTVFEAETVDAIGTGDAFVAGYLTSRIDGADVPTALERAAATAALKRTVAGDVAVVTPAEVDRVIAGDDGIDR